MMSIFTADGGPEGEPGFENLGGYGDLVALGRRVGLLAEDEVGRLLDEAARSLEEVGSVHARALELRGGIYEVCWAVAERERPPSAAMEHLHRVEGEAISRGRLLTREARARRGRIRLGLLPQRRQPLEALWAAAHAAIGLLTSRDLNRVKRCSSCCWLFVDASRNRSRR